MGHVSLGFFGVDFEGTGEHKQLFCGLNADKKAMVW